ncbi:CCR4-NOT transcription complex subunit 1-like isoform X2 [Telopea speciosissima]|uniref:CCR4-NOT transcription complex subunit 1-like isoform X2 n=1 Tax=Telopea speciosissima TaxID=54955 RepID=UPI001CC65D82|nr:CCR4-NOT transcription complex subunit 1-like isoform X2 [Telopea speciosissima]
MLPFSSTVSNQIRFLLQSLDDSNFDSVVRELCQFTEYGSEGSILLLQSCLDHTNFHSGDTQNMQLKPDFLAAIFRYLMDKPNFSTVFCEALRSTSITEAFLGDFCNALCFSVSEKIGIGLALSDSEILDIRTCGQNFCMYQIEEWCAHPTSVDFHGQIQNIVMFLHQSEGLVKHVDSFMRMLSLMQLKDISFVLDPFISDDLHGADSLRHLDLFYESNENNFDAVLAEIEKEISMADVMNELGYGFTINASHCKEVLSLFLPLTEGTLSQILSTIARTHSGLEDSQSTFSIFCSALSVSSVPDLPCLNSWNVDVLIDSIKQLAPGTNWVSVMENLDHEGFYFSNEEEFSFFMSVYANACQDPFPLHAICGSVWKNAEGQLSFLRYAVCAPPEIFTFGHSVRQLAYVDAVHGHKLPQRNANQAWLCLDLLEVLCHLAERGHAGSVRTILEYPLKNCPEALLLGMAHINTAFNLLQYDVSSTVLPMIIGNAMNSGVFLHLWHASPNLLVRGFIGIHFADPENMTRILGICQELKIISAVLDITPFSFSIKLAALASREEHINLEKWLNDNMSTHKDVFFKECLKFLREIPIDTAEDPANPFQHSGGVVNAYLESNSTFFKVLQAHASQITSNQLAEEMKKLHLASIHANPRLQNGGAVESTSDVYGDDIEAEANSYFHQMFSGQLTIDAMVQMLARFKDCPDKREQSIFECMIANLFEEYKFFPKYPERQLKIAAVLFGSLIKHQLVTHLTLGIALRGVLDALRKSADSKMFVFGAKALEQFVDRLVEWPQYCNHILQISHLRGTHAELVAFIERALARISLGHVESSGVNGTSNDQPQGFSQATSDNVEASDSSWPLMGSNATQPGPQLSSPLQLQQRHQGFLDDRNNVSATSVGYMKPLPSPAVQPSLVSAHDAVTNQKSIVLHPLQMVPSQNVGSGPAAMSSSPGFLRSSRGVMSTSMLRQHSYSTGFGSALNIETLVQAAERRDTPIEAPASEIQDKMLFIVNNISTANLEAKAKEFTEILKEQYYPWFAQYIVMKRASIEPNFHDLYLKFLEKVNSKALNLEIVKASYENCKVLLRSELIKSSSEERSLLKNLGSWLGKFTIGRNQALRAREIDPKVLIIEAYEKGLMIAVIPFTSKILEPCHSSLAYQPPNPWTMGILSLLTEIYALPNLKMNLKFDIEVLFKNLGVDMKDVKPTSLLKDRVREVEGNPDFSTKDIGASQPQMVAEINSGMTSTLNQVELQSEVSTPSHPGGHLNVLSQYTAPLHIASGSLVEDEKMANLNLSDRLSTGQGLSQVTPSQSPFSVSQLSTSIPSFGAHVVINPKLSALGLQLHFQRIVPMAMDSSIKEIMSPIVERSVTIAMQTTKELVLKDYAVESDENRIYHAAHLMVASLAGSLAHVTCKEPLRGSISSHLRNLLQALNIAGDILEQALLLVTNDNLDLGCAVIEQHATEKALSTIDGEIGQQLALRRKHREAVGPSYFDASTYTQGTMGIVPESLRPKPGRLSPPQQRVYEDFVTFAWQNHSNPSSNAVPAAPPVSSTVSVSSGQSRAYGSTTGQLNQGAYSSEQGAQGFGAVAQPMDLMSEEMDPGSQQLLSASSTHLGAPDGIIQHGSEINSGVASFPSTVAAPELHLVEPSTAVKELGPNAQPTLPTSATERLGVSITEPLLTTGDALEKYQLVAQKLETLVTKDAREAEIQGVIAEVPEIILRCISRHEAALAVAQKVFKSLYENASNSVHVGAHIAILVAIRDVCKLVVKELTSWVIYSDEERKFNKDITVGLIRSELLNLADYNVHMAKLIDAGRNKTATEFAISLLEMLVVQEPGVSVSELHNLVDAVAKLALRPGSPESLQQLVEIARNPASNSAALSGLTAGKEDKARQTREKKPVPGRSIAIREDYTNAESMAADPAGFYEQVSALFGEWCRICELPGANDAAYTHYISQLQQSGLLKGDDMSDRFFRILTELSAAYCVSTEVTPASFSLQPHQSPQMSFFAIDMYAKLIFLMLKYYAVDQGSNKLFLLPKILSVTVRVIQKDAEEKKTSFNPRPYFRLLINWLYDLSSPDAVLDGANFQVLTAFANAFHALQPLKVPGFSFAWLELVSHRTYMPKLLTLNPQKGWPLVQRLLVDLFKFLEPYLRNVELGEPVRFLYKGTLRVLLVLLHDFPEFLCDYHFSFCDVIPPSCIQMRNVILSAFPRNMRLPDPSTPNLKIDLLAEISQSPHILSEVDAALKAKQMKNDIDEYLKTRQQGSSFLAELKQRLLLPQTETSQAGTRYNVPLINSLVLYVGMQAIQQLQTRTPPPHAQPMAQGASMDIFLVGAAMDIFQTLIGELDTEGRYLFLNAVANQLRYPNNHTHYFSFVLLYLFAEANQEIIQEQITRVLLERLIVNRPHPWGLLITFIELIKNPRYNFWNRSFTRCAPEIEKLFESVSRSCGGPKPMDEGMVSGGISDNAH